LCTPAVIWARSSIAIALSISAFSSRLNRTYLHGLLDLFDGQRLVRVHVGGRQLAHGIRDRLQLGMHGAQLVPDDLLDAFDEGNREVVRPWAHGGRRVPYPARSVATLSQRPPGFERFQRVPSALIAPPRAAYRSARDLERA
jgi:hypothetical protein